MKTIYTSFSSFMARSLERAKDIDDFGKKETFRELTKILLSVPWTVFLILCVLLALGMIPFAIALPTFLINPLIAPLLIIYGVGLATALYKLHRERAIPLAVEAVGRRTESMYEDLKGQHDHAGIDALLEDSARNLVAEIRCRLR